MAFGDVANTATATSTGSPGSLTTSTAIAVSTGDLLIATFGCRTTSITVVNFTDSAGGSWTNLTNASTTTPVIFGAFQYITSASTNLTITASFNGTIISGGKVLCVLEFIGPFSSSPLDTNPAPLRTAGSTGLSNPTGGLSQTGELLFSYIDGNSNSTSWISSSPFNLITTVGVGSGTVQVSEAAASFISTSTASVIATWTIPAAGWCAIASFLPAPSTVAVFQWYPMDEIGLANERITRPSYEVVPYDA